MNLRGFFDPISFTECRQVDALFLASTACVVMLGLVMVSSASIFLSEANYGHPYYFMVRQSVYLVIGSVFGYFMMSISTEQLQKYSVLLMALSLVLLILVLMPGVGKTVNGSRRWIGLGIFNLQASEVAKVCMVVYVSGYLVRRADRVREKLVGSGMPMVVSFLFLACLLLEPDFGASVVLVGTVIALLFIAGAPIYQFIGLVVAVVAALGLVAISESYRIKRLLNFIDPWADPFNDGYQLSQALIAYGRGEWFGLGLGNSVQKLAYLPEAHTDFVFSIWVEETGMLGGLLLLAIFAMLTFRAFKIGQNAMRLGRLFQGYMSFGFAILILAQVIINVGVNTGFLPTKGLTLPLISYGGSSLIITLSSLFVIARVDIENRRLSNQGHSTSEGSMIERRYEESKGV